MNNNPNLRTSVLGNLIGSGEGGYYSFNRGNAGDSPGESLDPNITVGEIIRRQQLSFTGPTQLFAVGKYQMIGPNQDDPVGTFQRAVDALGISPNEKFTPELQERMFHGYLIAGKRPEIADYITGKTSGANGLYEAQLSLALEFASVGSPRKGGRGEHDGGAGNQASITLEESARALNQMRDKFLEGKRNGLSDSAAYAALQDQPVTMTNNPNGRDFLMRGDRGEAVRELQQKLTAAGFSTNGTDGIYGQDTESAVRRYQQSKNLTADGIAGQDTLRSLGIGQQQPTPNPTPNPTPTPTPTPNPGPSTGQITPPTGFGTWPAPENYEKNVDIKGDPRFGTPRSNSLGYHAGFDIGGKIGDPVVSFKAGVVDATGTDDPNINGGGAGHWIQIKHNDGTFTMYQHLKERPNFADNTPIKEGQQIGQIGDSGNASGVPQLHFEVRGGTGAGSSTAVNPSVAIQLDGMKGPKVLELQNLLKAAGYDVGTPDGDFGQRTKAAVTKWQQDNGLKPTGVVDGNTFEAIKNPEKYRGQPEPQPQPNPTPQPNPNPQPVQLIPPGVYRQGDGGEGVRKLQEALNKNGANLTVDGDFGQSTRAAVVAYQQKNGLGADGIAGEQTIAKLNQSLQQSPGTPSPQPQPQPDPGNSTRSADFGAQLRSSDLSKTSIYLAIGLAEGTINRDGTPNDAYFRHIDPGNGAVNKGFGSYQIKQDPLGRGEALTPQEADRLQADRLAGQWGRIDKALNDAGFKPGPARDLLAVSALDAWNQAPGAVFGDAGGQRFSMMHPTQLANLKRDLDSGVSPQTAVTQWRVEGYKRDDGSLDAPGFGNSLQRLSNDQARRVAALADGLSIRPTQQQTQSQASAFAFTTEPALAGAAIVAATPSAASAAMDRGLITHQAHPGNPFYEDALKVVDKLPKGMVSADHREIAAAQIVLDVMTHDRVKSIVGVEVTGDKQIAVSNTSSTRDHFGMIEMVDLKDLHRKNLPDLSQQIANLSETLKREPQAVTAVASAQVTPSQDASNVEPKRNNPVMSA
jgi:peptidoglycan hydrolase-like protein with peptidoglycan-binding domain